MRRRVTDGPAVAEERLWTGDRGPGAGQKLRQQMSRAQPPSPHLSRVDFGEGGKPRKGRLAAPDAQTLRSGPL